MEKVIGVLNRIIAAAVFVFGIAGIITIPAYSLSFSTLPAGLFAVLFFAALFVLSCRAAGLLERAEKSGSRLLPVLLHLWFFGVLACGIFSVSYIPCHDSQDMHALINDIFLKNPLTEYQTAYMNFTATNKLIIYFYSLAARLFGSVRTGVRILNALLLTGSCYLLAIAAGEMFGKKCRYFALFFLPLAAPYVLLSGPYIYLPAMLLAAAALALFLKGGKIRWLSPPVMGLLFTVRPTALAPILVIVFLHLMNEIKIPRDILKKGGALLLVFAVMFAVKASVGAVMYKSGLHKYPGMNTAAGSWTMELGTRPNANMDAGTCFYTAYALSDAVKEDEISLGFNRLWNLYAKNDSADFAEIKAVQKEISGGIKERTADLIKTNPSLWLETLRYKYINFYGDVYKPYYLKPNVHEKSLVRDLYTNPEYFYFLYENIIYGLFFLACIIMPFFRRRSRAAVDTMLSVFAVSVVFLLLTEVSKKYMFDFTAEMLLAFCGAVCALSKAPLRRRKSLAPKLSAALAAVIAAAGTYHYISEGRLHCFKNAAAELEMLSAYEAVLHFSGIDNPDGGYRLLLSDGSEITPGETADIPLKNNEFNSFAVILPNEKRLYVSSQIIQ